MSSPHKLLYVCRHNSVRSQIAAALTNKISRGMAEAYSAGPEPREVPEFLAQWIANITGQSEPPVSQHLDAVAAQRFDTIITLCDKSHDALPELETDSQHIRWDFSHADSHEALHQLEIEISERIRLMLLAKGLL